jgi:anti-sigma regulatory factor (Ser/Thr protein kinase)
MVAVIRRRTPPTEGRRHALGPLSHRLSPSAASVSVARGLLRAWLEAVPVEGEATQDLLLVATELCSNAVKHATWERGGVVLRAWTEDGDVFLEVDDDGEGLELPYLEESPPEPEAERGRGLWLVQTFSDDVVVAVDADRTCVRVCKRAVTSATD